MLMDAVAAIENSALASAIKGSFALTAGLSALHAVGFTLIMGGALFANLRLAGVLLRDRPQTEIVRLGTRSVAIGLVISVITGLLSFAPRAVTASASGIFQIKMLLLVTCIAMQFVVIRQTVRRHPAGSHARVGVLGVLLWVSLALAACAFILLE
jgi:hypothetical protein